MLFRGLRHDPAGAGQILAALTEGVRPCGCRLQLLGLRLTRVLDVGLSLLWLGVAGLGGLGRDGAVLLEENLVDESFVFLHNN